eukprot:scaffold86849_cov17-Tisochrysis_lutea.AAC.3
MRKQVDGRKHHFFLCKAFPHQTCSYIIYDILQWGWLFAVSCVAVSRILYHVSPRGWLHALLWGWLWSMPASIAMRLAFGRAS